MQRRRRAAHTPHRNRIGTHDMIRNIRRAAGRALCGDCRVVCVRRRHARLSAAHPAVAVPWPQDRAASWMMLLSRVVGVLEHEGKDPHP